MDGMIDGDGLNELAPGGYYSRFGRRLSRFRMLGGQRPAGGLGRGIYTRHRFMLSGPVIRWSIVAIPAPHMERITLTTACAILSCAAEPSALRYGTVTVSHFDSAIAALRVIRILSCGRTGNIPMTNCTR